MALTNSDIRFKVDFHLESATKNLVVTDLIQNAYNTTYGHTVANVRVIIKVVAPTGTIYENTGWATNSFASPDMNGNTSDWVSSAIALPTVGNGIATGYYEFQYKVSVDSGATVQASLVDPNQKKYYYNVTTPSITFDYEISCISSQIEFDDNNAYTVVDNSGNTKSPATTNRSWLIIYPQSILSNITETTDQFTIGYGTTYNAGSEIYRGEYKASLTTNLVYNLDEWSLTDSTIWVISHVEVSSIDIFDVECPDCGCNYYTCLVNLENRKEEYRTAGNQVQVSEIEKTINKLNWYWELYNLAVRCGRDYSGWCEKIKDYAHATSECCDDTSTTPTKITAWVTAIGGGSGSGTTWYFRTAAEGHISSPSVGDAEFFTTTAGGFTSGDVWSYTATGWVLQGNLTGSDGTTPAAILYNDITDSADTGGGLYETLKTYTLVGGTMASNGEIVEVEAMMDVKAGIDVMVYIEFGAHVVLSYQMNALIRTYFKVNAIINRTALATQVNIPSVTIYGIPDSQITLPLDNSIINLGADADIKITIDRLSTGVAGDITCKYLKVTKFNI